MMCLKIFFPAFPPLLSRPPTSVEKPELFVNTIKEGLSCSKTNNCYLSYGTRISQNCFSMRWGLIVLCMFPCSLLQPVGVCSTSPLASSRALPTHTQTTPAIYTVCITSPWQTTKWFCSSMYDKRTFWRKSFQLQWQKRYSFNDGNLKEGRMRAWTTA